MIHSLFVGWLQSLVVTCVPVFTSSVSSHSFHMLLLFAQNSPIPDIPLLLLNKNLEQMSPQRQSVPIFLAPTLISQ